MQPDFLDEPHRGPPEALLSATSIPVGEPPGLIDQLTAAGWLADSDFSSTQVTGRLTQRVLPFSYCPLP
ncbi:hypothetical protein [Streptomyces sp. NPDC059819]|uniref:hypothetical protein n=1 Tax=Streptomyces sp. NPDC059819 TaxID=3346963 RepID=UPI00364B0E10